MSAAAPESTCPACEQAKTPRMYLCSGCWFTLPSQARRALTKYDGMPAARRLGELHTQLRAGVPLHQIAISR